MKKYQSYLLLFFSFFFILSCKTEKEETNLKTGFWRGEITIQNQQLPFIFEVFKDNENFKINLHDGDNIIELNEVKVVKDSVFFTMHIFDIDVKAKINNNSLSGDYTKNYAKDYVLPFKAVFGKTARIDNAISNSKFDGKWDVSFHKDNGTDKKAIGLFKTEDNKIKGTILTKTGDYRFLDGTTDGNNFTLYGFDGNHLYIFKATLENDTIKGDYWSGKTLHQKFTGYKNENASLPDANKLTYLKKGYDKIEFSFPDLDGNQVTLNDPKYKDKVVILQVFGTWCPNCMDETKFYTKWYDKNKNRGVEIIGLAYEVKDDFEYAKARVQKMKDTYNVDYDFLIAGTSKRGNASKSLPMLNHIMSFPTSIIIDRKGKVRSIHTGFSGPATGDYYLHYVEEFNTLMDTLLSE
ncbi:MAG: TlpA family protein disulfide reductase [Flavobacteriaceae bacterium]|nr:TlpA family protein disulfide reductase [Flavobacteriaceae bacterium]